MLEGLEDLVFDLPNSPVILSRIMAQFIFKDALDLTCLSKVPPSVTILTSCFKNVFSRLSKIWPESVFRIHCQEKSHELSDIFKRSGIEAALLIALFEDLKLPFVAEIVTSSQKG